MHVEPLILVCFAVKEEAKFFKPSRTNKWQVQVRLTGMGARNAEDALRGSLSKVRPQLVLSAGFAGGLNPELTIGTVVFDGAEDAGLTQALVQAGARRARFHFSRRIVTSAEEKKDLRAKTGAEVVEMESQIIGAVCREHQVRCVTVRVVLDTAAQDLPIDFNRFLTPDERLALPKLALAVITNPGLIPSLLRLRKQSDLAAKRLAEVLGRVVEQGVEHVR